MPAANKHGNTPDTAVVVNEISVCFSAPEDTGSPSDVHPQARGVHRKAFAAELEHLPDIRDRLLELAGQAGYTTDVEVAIASITDAADEIVDAVEGEDPGALDD